MAIDTDLLNTTLPELKGPLEHTFEQQVPMYDFLEEKGRTSTEGGLYIQRTLMGGSPARGRGIFVGTETLPMERIEQTQTIKVSQHRLVVAINIPKKVMRLNNGKLGAMKLIKEYPAAVLKLIPADLDRFFFTGVSSGLVFDTSELIGFNTFNGQKVFAPVGATGVTNGILDFAATSAQTDTCQSLAKSDSYNYVNQFGEISSFALDGKKTYRKVFRDCARWLPGKGAIPDRCFVDYDSFALIEDEQDSHVHISVQGDTSEKDKLMETTLSGVRVVASKNIVLTDFTGSAASGVGYVFSAEGVELVWDQKPTMSEFDDKVANQDFVTAKMEMQFAILVQGLRVQGAIAGGARP